MELVAAGKITARGLEASYYIEASITEAKTRQTAQETNFVGIEAKWMEGSGRLSRGLEQADEGDVGSFDLQDSPSLTGLLRGMDKMNRSSPRLGHGQKILPMQLPQTSPRNDPVALWAFQQNLLSIAEADLGARDASKKIYQPGFTDDGPHICNTPELDGAFAELSRNSECYWPTAIYEMAHETVHLLNPVPGNGNYLGEGVAVAFSVYVQTLFGLQPQPIGLASYQHALELVCRLPNGPLEAARQIRAAVGALSQVTAQHLEDLFPDVDRETLSNLAAPFVRNAD